MFVTCHGGSCFSFHGGSCFFMVMVVPVFHDHGSSCFFFHDHGGSCLLHVMVVHVCYMLKTTLIPGNSAPCFKKTNSYIWFLSILEYFWEFQGYPTEVKARMFNSSHCE